MGVEVNITQDIENAPYKLYVGAVSENIPKGVKYSLVPSSLKYLLLYTNQPILSKKFVLVEEEDTSKFPREVQQWLFATKFEINMRYMKKQKELIDNTLNSFIDILADELEKEKTTRQVKSDSGKTTEKAQSAGERRTAEN